MIFISVNCNSYIQKYNDECDRIYSTEYERCVCKVDNDYNDRYGYKTRRMINCEHILLQQLIKQNGK